MQENNSSINNLSQAIQRALAEARRQGATQAVITLDQPSSKIVLEDDRNGPSPHVATFAADLQSATRDHWNIMDRMRRHPAPEGLNTTLVSEYKGHRHQEKLKSASEGLIARDTTPDGGFLVSITKIIRHCITVMAHNGTSSIIPSYYTHHIINETAHRAPGTPIEQHSISIVAEALNPGRGSSPEINALATITKTAAKLIADYILQKAEDVETLIWPNETLREFIEFCNPDRAPLPAQPSLSDYYVESNDGTRTLTTSLTPENTVSCDYDTVQAGMLNRAMREHAPRHIIPAATADPDVPTIRLIKANIQNLDNSVTEYPVNLWDMEGRSGRYDNKPLPHGQRLPHSRVEKVKNVTLTMEINPGPNGDPDVFTFDTDLYVDQDQLHHLLLVKEDANIPAANLEQISYLHSPRREDPNVLPNSPKPSTSPQTSGTTD